MQQISLGKTLDVEVVERELSALWQETRVPTLSNNEASEEEGTEEESAVLRARAANLLVFVTDEKSLAEVHELAPELTAAHPSRVLAMSGQTAAPDLDIEMYVSVFTQKEKHEDPKRLCCEEVTLKAQGSFVPELPSAALPLLVSDLPTFLWWRAAIDRDQKVFNNLLHASDRLVIDSVEFADPLRELAAVNALCHQSFESPVGISDLNWERLTSWRGLLADFYDVPVYRAALDAIDTVRIHYVAPAGDAGTLAPQALLMAGWLASRLRWTMTSEAAVQEGQKTTFSVSNQQNQTITIELQLTDQAGIKPGRLARVELGSSKSHDASFKVERSQNRECVLTEANLGADVQRGRVLPVRNRSTAQLLSREMEILSNDQIYQEALEFGALLFERCA